MRPSGGEYLDSLGMGATILRPLLRLGRITNPFLARPTYLKPTDQPMYAVVDDRNQQFRAEPGERVQVPHNESWEPGTKVTFDKVCLVTGDKSQIGAPYVDGVSVTATVVGQVKGPKLIVQKIRRRKNSRRRTGFRAQFTEIKIDSIEGV